MEAKLLKLKQLAASYIAALEFDYCPDEEPIEDIRALVTTSLTDEQLQEGLDENSGRAPHELARELAEFIESDF